MMSILIIVPVNAFGAFGHPELNDVPSMRCKLKWQVVEFVS